MTHIFGYLDWKWAKSAISWSNYQSHTCLHLLTSAINVTFPQSPKYPKISAVPR